MGGAGGLPKTSTQTLEAGRPGARLSAASPSLSCSGRAGPAGPPESATTKALVAFCFSNTHRPSCRPGPWHTLGWPRGPHWRSVGAGACVLRVLGCSGRVWGGPSAAFPFHIQGTKAGRLTTCPSSHSRGAEPPRSGHTREGAPFTSDLVTEDSISDARAFSLTGEWGWGPGRRFWPLLGLRTPPTSLHVYVVALQSLRSGPDLFSLTDGH